MGYVRAVLNLENGERREIRNGPAGAWIGTDGVAHSMAVNNCWTEAGWFHPLLTLEAAAADPTYSVTLGNDGHSIDRSAACSSPS